MTESSPVRLPARFLADLSERCGRAGPEAAEALREAGRGLGGRLVEDLPDERGPERAPPERFWEAASDLLTERGLGAVAFEVRSPGVAELRLESGPEAADGWGAAAGRDGCPLATGLLAGVLTAAAGEPVAVLEVECGATEGGPCRWLAGSRETLEEVSSQLGEGASVREALEAR